MVGPVEVLSSGCCCCINIQSFYMTAGWLKMCNSKKGQGEWVVADEFGGATGVRGQRSGGMMTMMTE